MSWGAYSRFTNRLTFSSTGGSICDQLDTFHRSPDYTQPPPCTASSSEDSSDTSSNDTQPQSRTTAGRRRAAATAQRREGDNGTMQAATKTGKPVPWTATWYNLPAHYHHLSKLSSRTQLPDECLECGSEVSKAPLCRQCLATVISKRAQDFQKHGAQRQPLDVPGGRGCTLCGILQPSPWFSKAAGDCKLCHNAVVRFRQNPCAPSESADESDDEPTSRPSRNKKSKPKYAIPQHDEDDSSSSNSSTSEDQDRTYTTGGKDSPRHVHVTASGCLVCSTPNVPPGHIMCRVCMTDAVTKRLAEFEEKGVKKLKMDTKSGCNICGLRRPSPLFYTSHNHSHCRICFQALYRLKAKQHTTPTKAQTTKTEPTTVDTYSNTSSSSASSWTDSTVSPTSSDGEQKQDHTTADQERPKAECTNTSAPLQTTVPGGRKKRKLHWKTKQKLENAKKLKQEQDNTTPDSDPQSCNKTTNM
eukprot:TRINITY_DN113592_c0_g1_i1.p1 TRINITY_DN113592_c0_g1~~TRINITY_DN113592_c0_g1_i1.p1  ORF type:complete len:472 (-),score=26.14 TRINITY_DN113592_c0_g1_i1:353-1768(-)